MSLIAYKKDFKVHKNFDLTKFIQVLDEENFYPFILYIDKLSELKYKLSFNHTRTPIFVTPITKRNIADEILLSECTLEFLKSVGKIYFVASIRNGTIIVIGFIIILFTSIPIFVHTIFAWIPIMIFILFQILKYYWDIRRYDRIGEIATNFYPHTTDG